MPNHGLSILNILRRNRPLPPSVIVYKDLIRAQSKPPTGFLAIASKWLLHVPAPAGKHSGTGMLKLLEKYRGWHPERSPETGYALAAELKFTPTKR